MTDENRDIETVESIDATLPETKDTDASDMLPKAAISKIVEREREKAFEKGRRAAMAEIQNTQSLEPVQGNAPAMSPMSQGTGQVAPPMSEQDIVNLIMQKAPEALMQQVNEHKTQQMVTSFADKIQTAEARYPGLEQKLNQLNYHDPAMLKLVEMANNLENTGDIMNELVSNPNKMMQVLSGIREQPFLAQTSLSSLSNSIKQNQQAAQENAQAKAPIPQLKGSVNSGMVDAGNLSVNDLRKMLSR